MLIREETEARARRIGKTLQPLIQFSLKTLATIRYIVDNVDTEVGWLGTVDKINDNHYVVKDIFLPKQDVNGGTCELNDEGLFELYEQLTNSGREDDLDKIRFWGHSHGNGGVSPSGQDEEQAIEMLKNNTDYLIRAIANKSGKMAISYFNYSKQYAIDNVLWQMNDGVNHDEIKKEFEPLIKENVKTLGYQNNNFNRSGSMDYYGDDLDAFPFPGQEGGKHTHGFISKNLEKKFGRHADNKNRTQVSLKS